MAKRDIKMPPSGGGTADIIQYLAYLREQFVYEIYERDREIEKLKAALAAQTGTEV